MQKILIITEHSTSALTERVNQKLDELKQKVISLHYQTMTNEQNNIYSVMIVYSA